MDAAAAPLARLVAIRDGLAPTPVRPVVCGEWRPKGAGCGGYVDLMRTVSVCVQEVERADKLKLLTPSIPHKLLTHKQAGGGPDLTDHLVALLKTTG